MDLDKKLKFKLMADVLSAASHEIRLAILDYLADGEQCVCDIAEHVEANRSNVSRHLSVMLNAGLVSQRKDGLKMMYSLKAPCILKVTECATGLLREQARQAEAILKRL